MQLTTTKTFKRPIDFGTIEQEIQKNALFYDSFLQHKQKLTFFLLFLYFVSVIFF